MKVRFWGVRGSFPVPGFETNRFGTADWYGGKYYQSGERTNPQGPTYGEQRVLRGGSWSNFTRNLRVSDRYRNEPSYRSVSIGFRCGWE